MKQHKFNWIDGLVLAVVLLLAAGTCLKFLVMDKTAVTREGVSFTYEVRIEGVRQYTIDAITEGDTLYESEGKGVVGVIESISTEPATNTAAYPDGTTKEVPIEDRYDVTVTVSAQGTAEGGRYQVGTYDIGVGRDTSYFTKYSAWSGTIRSITGPEE